MPNSSLHSHLNKILALSSVLFLMYACKLVKPNLMLRTPRNFPYDTVPSSHTYYKIATNDLVSIQFAPNKGYKIFEQYGATDNIQGMINISLKVEEDGTVNFPLLGRIELRGLTLREAEQKLRQLLSVYFNDPYISVSVSNRRIIIFPGGVGTARVLPLERDNMTLLEALALAGGIPPSGKAYKIKVIRGGLKNPKVYLFDLSTLESAKNADFILQADDIIYVEPAYQIPQEILNQITPWITLVNTLLAIVSFIIVLKR